MDRILQKIPQILLIPDFIIHQHRQGMFCDTPLSQNPDISDLYDPCIDELCKKYPIH